MTGWINFKLFRSRIHRREVLTALLADLKLQAPDHIAITGDISSMGFPQEFQLFGDLISNLGLRREQVSMVPGNHDAYTWRGWIKGSALAELGRFCTSDLHGGMPGFPFVRFRGPLALIGLDSAFARPPFVASGNLGREQIRCLADILRHESVRMRFPILLIHHPPLAYPSWHKEVEAGLLDRERFVMTLRRELQGNPALVLCGHWHRRRHVIIDSEGPIEAFQISSASRLGGDPERRAAYYLFKFSEGRCGVRLEDVEVRSFDRQSLGMVAMSLT
jgi:3',5'-cyclic AMP phosphodiesterase CpdA